MPTLNDLMHVHDVGGFVFADAGQGSSCTEGRFCEYDEAARDEYGFVVLHDLTPRDPYASPHTSADGVECHYASDWITVGEGDNPYRYRIYL